MPGFQNLELLPIYHNRKFLDLSFIMFFCFRSTGLLVLTLWSIKVRDVQKSDGFHYDLCKCVCKRSPCNFSQIYSKILFDHIIVIFLNIYIFSNDIVIIHYASFGRKI